jgi:lantibiotic modifying enzyme
VYLNSLWGTSRFEQVAESAATYLLSGQSAQGEWTLPPGVEGLSGQSLTGFAHGAAGILYFLAEYAEVSGDKSVKARVETGVERLLARASRDSQSSAYEWPYSDTDPVKWKWWCHGSPGIALLFLRLFERFGDRRYADIARDSLRQHPPAVRVANLGQCHGLAGLGEIYLEATRVLDDTHFHDRAHDIAVTLLSLAERNTSGNASWVVENADAVTADLMLGMGGVFHFLLRAAGHFDRIGLPLLCDPIKVVGL